MALAVALLPHREARSVSTTPLRRASNARSTIVATRRPVGEGHQAAVSGATPSRRPRAGGDTGMRPSTTTGCRHHRPFIRGSEVLQAGAGIRVDEVGVRRQRFRRVGVRGRRRLHAQHRNAPEVLSAQRRPIPPAKPLTNRPRPAGCRQRRHTSAGGSPVAAPRAAAATAEPLGVRIGPPASTSRPGSRCNPVPATAYLQPGRGMGGLELIREPDVDHSSRRRRRLARSLRLSAAVESDSRRSPLGGWWSRDRADSRAA